MFNEANLKIYIYSHFRNDWKLDLNKAVKTFF